MFRRAAAALYKQGVDCMKRLISCVASFALAFSMFGIPGVSFAASTGESNEQTYSAKGLSEGSDATTEQTEAVESAESTEHKAPESDPSINVEELKDADGNFKQVTGSAQLFANNSDLAQIDETENPSADREAVESDLLNDEVATLALSGNEIEGSLLTVTLHTYKKTPTIKNLCATVKSNDGAIKLTSSFFAKDKPNENVLVANLTQSARIPAGDYELRIEGGDYVPYSQPLTVENGNRMNVVLGDNQEDIFLESYGLIPYGDFNKDGAVTNADVAVLANAAASGSNDDRFDIDYNSVVDISDIQLFAVSLEEGSAYFPTDDSLVQAALGPANVRKDASNTKIEKTGTIAVAHEATSEDGEVNVDQWTEEDANFEQLVHSALLESEDTTVVLGTDNNAPISESNQVAIEIATDVAPGTDEETIIPMEGMTISFPTVSAVEGSSAPSAGVIQVEGQTEGGEDITKDIPFGEISESSARNAVDAALRSLSDKAYAADAEAKVDASNGLITVDFGSRIAVKKIKIVITETTDKNASLVEIGTVEFLNNMKEFIAPPQLSIPKNIVATPGAKRIDVKWDQEANVSGYQIRFQMGGKTLSQTTVNPEFALTEWPHSLMKDVKAGVYQITIRSISGEWSSPWSDPVTCEVVASEKPKKPTSVNVKAGYKELVVSWPAVEDAEWYNLYYKKNVATAQFQKYPNDITGTSLTLLNLEASTEYVLYLTASNNIGTSEPSDQRVGTTYGEIAVKVPWYNLVNRQVQYPTDESQAATISNVTITNGANADKTMDPRTMVDGFYDTGYRFHNQNGGVMLEFDDEYTVNSVAITSSLQGSAGYGSGGVASASVSVYDASGNEVSYGLDNVMTKTDVGKGAPNTYCYTFPASKAKRIRIQQGRYYNFPLSIAEIAVYESDGISESIEALWADDVRTALNPGVTEETIAAIEAKVNTADPKCGEKTPKEDLYKQELSDARDVLSGLSDFRQPRYFDSTVDNNVDRNVNGINGWQPLGIAGYEGEKLEVFVGGINTNTKQRCNKGSGTGLSLVLSQFNSESENVSCTIAENLKIGQNSVTIPANISSLNAEHGGQIYVNYGSPNKPYLFGVRVLGGMDIATLDLHNIDGRPDDVETERLARCKAYVEDLAAYCGDSANRHEKHATEFATYSDTTCIANTTDIMMDDMMYSVPASQILRGLKSTDADGRAAELNESLKSMEFMMKLFYQHKGLTNKMGNVTDYGTVNGIPKGHLNIRCMRMKEGVFMYAAGNHIGVPYGSTNLSANGPFEYDSATGKHQSGHLFGWGIAHEIGHDINQSAYTIAEVTNNYYSQLATNVNGSTTSRYSNQALYDKVTSGIYAPLSGAVGIGCYWQLHLAYDNYYNFKTFDSYADQMNNLFFARMDAYARNPSAAPTGATKKIPLNVSGGTDNALARLACAAAQKDLTAYFDAWGLTLNAETKEYASQFKPETRPIQYVSDEAQDYRIKGGSAVAPSANLNVSMSVQGQAITQPTKVSSRSIQLNISQTGANVDGLIGYEIMRNGKAVAFQQIEGNSNIQDGMLTYTDNIATTNNRTFVYSVCAVDKLLNRSTAVTLPEVKVSDDGTIADKSRWTATTNMTSAGDTKYVYNENTGLESNNPLPCENEVQVAAIDNVIDGDAGTEYAGELPANGSVTNSEGAPVDNVAPYIQVTFGGEKQITAIKVPTVDADIVRKATISVSTDGQNWTDIPAGAQIAAEPEGTTTFYFDEENDPQLKIYKASMLRLTGSMDSAKSGGMTLHEIDVLGVTGDNVDFLSNINGAVGTLSASVTYADESGVDENGASLKGQYTIPAGALVFLGEYKGDTAYNALKMYDQDGDLVPGTQVFFADVPTKDRSLGETADGRWIWYMTDEDLATYTRIKEAKGIIGKAKPDSVRLTLYRVDDAMTLANERAVADTMTLQLPQALPKITLQVSGDYKDFVAPDFDKQGN